MIEQPRIMILMTIHDLLIAMSNQQDLYVMQCIHRLAVTVRANPDEACEAAGLIEQWLDKPTIERDCNHESN